MTEGYKQKIKTLTQELKKCISCKIAAGRSNLKVDELAPIGFAEWGLTVAYIDWYVEMYSEVDCHSRYDDTIVTVLEDFLNKCRDDEENQDIMKTIFKFHYLKENLADCREDVLRAIYD